MIISGVKSLTLVILREDRRKSVRASEREKNKLWVYRLRTK